LGYDEYEKLVSRREIAGQEILDKARQALGQSSVELYEELLEGPPTEAILKVAKIRQVDLIVVGSRGLGSIQEMLLGGVSHQVLHHATCPVLVVR
jgi:nucleotide-binding universal stress UspA family protein